MPTKKTDPPAARTAARAARTAGAAGETKRKPGTAGETKRKRDAAAAGKPAAPGAPGRPDGIHETGLTHLDESGAARMVNVSGKAVTRRVATAKGIIRLGPIITEAIVNQALKKGDALAVARIAGIMAAKNTSRAIPLCHPLFLTGCDVELRVLGESHSLEAVCTVSTDGTTGVEMEALNGVSGALLTVYDMAKALDKGMVIGPVWLVEKSGGKSGTYRAGPGTPST